MYPKRIALFAVLAISALIAPTSAHADTSSDASAILTNIAAHAIHGYANINDSYEEMETRIARGEHIGIACGQISVLGVRALQRSGIPARYISAFSSQRADLMDVPDADVESHAMLEAWTGSRWELYDLDSNVQPVDADGAPVTIQQFADMPVRHYRTLATDALYDPTNSPSPLYGEWLYANHEAWYDRVLDIVAIYDGGGSYVYSGAGPADVLAQFSYYRYVSPDEFAAVAARAPASLAPVPAADSPAPSATADVNPAVAVAVSLASPVVVKPPVSKPRRRFVTKIRHHKVFRVYGHGRKARWVYVRRASR